MTTTVIEILLCVALIIGLIIMLQKAKLIIFFVNIPGIVCYILILIWTLAFDIYYSCVFKRYAVKGEHKGDKKAKFHDMSQDTSRIQIFNPNQPHLNQQLPYNGQQPMPMI